MRIKRPVISLFIKKLRSTMRYGFINQLVWQRSSLFGRKVALCQFIFRRLISPKIKDDLLLFF